MNREKAGYTEGIVSILTNIILFALKIWAGVVSGSIALVADAWHTLSDSFSSLVVIAGVKLSSRKADKEHPFGHGRWEQIAAIFIAFLLGSIAFDFLLGSVSRFRAGETADFGTLAIVVTILSIVMKEALAQYAFFIARKTDNAAVKADGWHHRTDALSSVVVLVGISLKNYFWWIDSALGLIISLMLFYAAYEIIKEAVRKILGEKPSPELIDKIHEIIHGAEKGDLKAHHFHIHDYGTHKELTFHIELNPQHTIAAGHEVATRIENTIREKLNIESTIHVEPLGVGH